MENDFFIRSSILSWMQNIKVFKIEDLLEFLRTTPMQHRSQYYNIAIELLNSPLMTSMYSLYRLRICI